MRIIAVLVLIFGAALAGGAIYFANDYLSQYEARLASQKGSSDVKTINVIVARVVLPYGTALDANEHLRWVEWPEASVPAGVFTDANDLLGADGKWTEKRFVLRQIEAGEPILESKVTGFGEQQRMAMGLSDGRRAVSISIDAVSGVSGFINPGDRVDVFMIRGSGAELSSNLILENIQIIAVDQQTNTERNAPVAGRTVTVEVTPTEAQKLALAQQVGRLSLTLRGFGEQEIVGGTPDQRSIGMQDLLGVERRERTGTSVTVRKGGAVTDSVTFE